MGHLRTSSVLSVLSSNACVEDHQCRTEQSNSWSAEPVARLDEEVLTQALQLKSWGENPETDGESRLIDRRNLPKRPECRIQIHRGRNRHNVEQFSFLSSDAITAEAFCDRFGGDRLIYSWRSDGRRRSMSDLRAAAAELQSMGRRMGVERMANNKVSNINCHGRTPLPPTRRARRAASHPVTGHNLSGKRPPTEAASCGGNRPGHVRTIAA